MRHLVQFIVPMLIFVGVVVLLARRRRSQEAQRADGRPPRESDTGAFLVILSLGAAVAIVAFLALQSLVD